MADEATWLEILKIREDRSVFINKLKRSKRKRKRYLEAYESDENTTEESHPPTCNYDPKLERDIIEKLLNPMLSLPISGRKLVDSENVLLALEKLEIQGLLNLQYKSNNTTAMVVSVNLDRLSRIAENMGLTGEGKGMPKFTSTSEELEWLLNAPSLKDRENRRVGGEIQELLTAKSFREQLMIEKFQSAGGSQLREFCPHKTREDCRRSSSSGRACPRLHFRKIIQNHTDESLGDCSFLNTCFHLETCKFVHYTIDLTQETEPRQKSSGKTTGLATLKNPEIKLTPPQWINCDIRSLDMSILGKFTIIMADPPWDIHMELPYGTMGDDEMRQLGVPILQDDGYMFLWVTGRAMELGRECLTLWGYERIGEMAWVKTNQLQRLIRTGRTGHWINHGKEHCLIGLKGNPQTGFNRGIDCDVLVAEVRATSRKPDEMYGILERLSPGTRKIEMFGRAHNCQPNWLTLGNQLDGVKIHDPDLQERFFAKYGNSMGIMPSIVPPPQ